MPLDAATFEKLGMFYLGRVDDSAESAPGQTPLLMDSRDLVTHAVIVGMTGSGKTGLGIGLLEEAAIDGIPALVIDPKGDLANLALRFPQLAAEDFRPWVSAEDAAREDVAVEAFAEREAKRWRDGLAAWGQGPERIARWCAAGEVAVFTPGSTAGRPLSVLASFDAPPTAVREDAELFAERVESTASALLGLAGVADAGVTSREQTLIAGILSAAWSAGESLSLVELVRRVHQPPFTTVGVLDVESFFPEKDRFKLVLALNNLLASPGFAAWRQGEPLDVGSLLFNREGRPRLAVLSLAHLGDAERMFFVALLLNATVSWMRAQAGTTSLRALLFMDEVFGFFPPVANPPSKRPLLTLLKQARAFGLGVVLGTQNPADLDYKGLANAGTWFIGRLQTERDRARLLDGLGDAGAADREALAVLLAGLGKRRFVCRSVHEPAPVRFETRWTLSYLCGPLTREQIRRLEPGGAQPAAEVAPAVSDGESGAPVLRGITQRFAVSAAGPWRPGLLVSASLGFRDARRGLNETRDEALYVPLAGEGPLWAEAETVRIEDFPERVADGGFAPLPAAAREPKNYAAWAKDAVDWLTANRAAEVLRCPALRLESKPDEAPRDFRARVAQAWREARDERADALREKFARRLSAADEAVRRAGEAVTREEAQAGQARLQTALSVGSAILGAFLGRRALSATNLGRAATAARGAGRAMKEAGDVGTARERLARAEESRAALAAEMETELATLTASLAEPEIESRRIPPARGAVRVRAVDLAWRAVG